MVELDQCMSETAMTINVKATTSTMCWKFDQELMSAINILLTTADLRLVFEHLFFAKTKLLRIAAVTGSHKQYNWYGDV